MTKKEYQEAKVRLWQQMYVEAMVADKSTYEAGLIADQGVREFSSRVKPVSRKGVCGV